MVQSAGPTTTPREPITMKSLLEAGVHFGHQTRRWNPHMKRYIFTHRNGIHIIDLQQTLVLLEEACRSIRGIVAYGGDVLFVGTKKQAQDGIQSEAARCGMPYITQRWLGGTLTNFRTIRSRVDHMVQLEEKKEKGQFQSLTKREGLKLEEEILRLQKYFGGIRDMKKLPGALFIVDMEKEDICVAEVRRMGIPVTAVVDSNCNPELVDFPIPGNDDAIRSIRLIASRIADAVIAGLQEREALSESEEESEGSEEGGPLLDLVASRNGEDFMEVQQGEALFGGGDGSSEGVPSSGKEAPLEVSEGPAKDVEEEPSEIFLARTGDDLAESEEEDRTAE